MRAAIITGLLALTGLVFFTAVQTVTVPDNSDQVAALEAELGKAQTALATQTDELTGKLSALEAVSADQVKAFDVERNTLEDALTKARQGVDTANAEIERLNGLTENTSALEAQIAALTQSQSTLIAENAAFSESAAVKDATLVSLQNELEAAREASANTNATVQSLNADVAKARAEIETLQAQIAELEADRAEAFATIAELEAAAPHADGTAQIAALEALIAEQAEALEAAQSDVPAALATQMAGYETQIDALTADIAERDSKIEKLRTIATLQASVSTPAADNSTLESCQNRTNAVLANTAISFDSGLTTITPASVAVLDQLAKLAAECMAKDLVLEIEGHTDNSGGDASNLLLSNGRAQAVYAFLTERAVPADAMRAVGFGETDPIADNATADGRAQNRRIVFDWEQR